MVGYMDGHYEVRVRPMRSGALVDIVWVPPQDGPMRVITIAPERVPLLAEALNSHLQGADKDQGRHRGHGSGPPRGGLDQR